MQDLADDLLRLGRRPGEVVHVGDVVARLVAHAQLPHTDGLRLAHLVDRATVGARLVGVLRRGEELVKLVLERLPPAVQVRQALAVLRDGEREVPAIGLRVRAAPHCRVLDHGIAGAVASFEELLGRVEDVHVVQGALQEVRRLLAEPVALRRREALVLRERRAEVADAEVVDESVEAPRHRLGGVGRRVSEEQ